MRLLGEVDALYATPHSEGAPHAREQATHRLQRLEAAIAVQRHEVGSSAHETDGFGHGEEARPLPLGLTADGYVIRGKGADPRLLLRDKSDGQPPERSHGELKLMGHGCLAPRVWDVLQRDHVIPAAVTSDESGAAAAALQFLGVADV